MDKVYARIFWENAPSTKSPLGATNLNRTDYAINEIDNRVIKHDVEKADKAEILNLVNGWTMDEQTGIITVTKFNGERMIFDLNIEKIPVDFSLSPDGILTMTTADGTQFTANIGAMIPVLEFESTDTIAVSVTGEGVNKTYSFSVKDGSITADKLQPDYLADVTVQAENASAAATAAADSAKAAKDSETNAAQSAADAAGVKGCGRRIRSGSKTLRRSSGSFTTGGSIVGGGSKGIGTSSKAVGNQCSSVGNQCSGIRADGIGKSRRSRRQC